MGLDDVWSLVRYRTLEVSNFAGAVLRGAELTVSCHKVVRSALSRQKSIGLFQLLVLLSVLVNQSINEIELFFEFAHLKLILNVLLPQTFKFSGYLLIDRFHEFISMLQICEWLVRLMLQLTLGIVPWCASASLFHLTDLFDDVYPFSLCIFLMEVFSFWVWDGWLSVFSYLTA